MPFSSLNPILFALRHRSPCHIYQSYTWHYSPTGRRSHSRPLKRLLDTCERNGSTSGTTPWNIYDDNDTWCSSNGQHFRLILKAFTSTHKNVSDVHGFCVLQHEEGWSRFLLNYTELFPRRHKLRLSMPATTSNVNQISNNFAWFHKLTASKMAILFFLT